MNKFVEIGKTYFRDSDGLYIDVCKEHSVGCYECRCYEVDDDGNEINEHSALLTDHDILRR